MPPQLATSATVSIGQRSSVREAGKLSPEDEAFEKLRSYDIVDSTDMLEDPENINQIRVFGDVKNRSEVLHAKNAYIAISGASTLYIVSSRFIEKVELHDLEKTGVKIVDNAGVEQYLAAHPDMWQPVMNICRTAKNCFPKKTSLSLEILKDPEGHEEHLVLYVRQREYADDIMDTIDRICEKHDAELAAMSGWILLTTDFQPPR